MSETRIALANWKECAIASISIYICRGRKYIYTKKKKTAIYRGPCCCWFLFYTTVCMMASLLLAWLHHNRRSLYTSPGGSVPSISISLYVYNINMLLYIHDGVCCCVCTRWSGHVEKGRAMCRSDNRRRRPKSTKHHHKLLSLLVRWLLSWRAAICSCYCFPSDFVGWWWISLRLAYPASDPAAAAIQSGWATNRSYTIIASAEQCYTINL